MDRGPVARLNPDRFPAPRQRRADGHVIDAVRDQVRHYALDEHVPRVRQLLDRVERTGRERDLRELRDVITPFVTFHEREHPFAIAPRGVLSSGEFTVLHQLTDHQPVRITREELAQGGVLFIGSSGTGKSTLLLHVIDQVLRQDLKVWIVDPKDDARHLVRDHHDLLVLDSNAPINLLKQPPYLTRAEHLANIEEAIARAMYGGQTVRAILHEALTKPYETSTDPTFHDLIATLEHLPRKGDTYQRVDAIRNTLQRLRRLIERYPGLAARNGLAPHELCEHSLLIPILEYSDLEDVLVTYLARVLFQHHRAHRITNLTHLIAIDEALLAVREDHQRIGGNPITELHAMTREYGIAWAISVNSITLTDAQLRNNAYLQIALNLHSSEDVHLVANTFGMTTAEAEYHRRSLTRGQAIARLGDRWRRPILCTFPPLDTEKYIDSATWTAACARIATLVAARTTGTSLAAREGDESNGQPTPAQTAAPSSSPPSRVAPVVEETIPPNAWKVALNRHDAALLEDVAVNDLTPTTAAYTRIGIHWTQGDRSKQRLLRLELLIADRVVVRPGRGGTASVLRLTAGGWEWLGHTPPKRTRGGSSAQHDYFVYALARAISHACIEEQLGEKSVDLAVPYNTIRDRDFVERVIARSALAACATLRDGEILGIEVDLRRRTALNNATKNTTALTIIATMPTETDRIVARLRLELTPEQLAYAIVINVFDLLAIARESYARTA